MATTLHVIEGFPRIWGHTCTLIGDDLYVYGGVANQELQSKLWKINFITKTVNLVHCKMYPCARSLHTTVLYNNSLIVYGGHDAYDMELSDVWSFEFVESAWRKLSVGDVHDRCSGHKSVIYNDKMYVLGQCPGGNGSRGESFRFFDFQSLQWTAIKCKIVKLVATLDSHDMIVYKDELVIFGSFHDESYLYMNCLVAFYNFATGKWRSREISFDVRISHSCILYNHKMYVVGGICEVNIRRGMGIFDLDYEATVRDFTVPPIAVCSTSCVLWNNRILVVSGTEKPNKWEPKNLQDSFRIYEVELNEPAMSIELVEAYSDVIIWCTSAWETQ
jgi:N-acetylneuraminic acid mutarotase